MKAETMRVNSLIIKAWTVINIVLAASYLLEVLKGTRTVGYVVVFACVLFIPEIISVIIYKRKPEAAAFKYEAVVGYLIMYTFVMITGNTFLVFTYIFPMLTFMILYHKKRLILTTGIIVLIINLIFIYIWSRGGIGGRILTLENSRDHEIQIALICLCFAGSYATARLYESISQKNIEYVLQINKDAKHLKEMTLQSIHTIVKTIDAKDDYTKGHSQRVSYYSYVLARALGSDEEEANNVRVVALLHDIGKIGVPDAILNKRGSLTDEEFEIMKTHSEVGANILKDITYLPGLEIGALYHHERYDGTGYPKGLKGDEIPYVAKVICIADAYDAMSSNRVYRKRLPEDKILEEFEKCKGLQFDPKMTDTFINLIKEGKIKPLAV